MYLNTLIWISLVFWYQKYAKLYSQMVLDLTVLSTLKYSDFKITWIFVYLFNNESKCDSIVVSDKLIKFCRIYETEKLSRFKTFMSIQNTQHFPVVILSTNPFSEVRKLFNIYLKALNFKRTQHLRFKTLSAISLSSYKNIKVWSHAVLFTRFI